MEKTNPITNKQTQQTIMGLNLKVKKRVLNFTKEKKEVYVATPERGNTIDAEKIAELIAQDTGARPAQVKMILDTLIDSMMTWLEEGHGVQLGSFGSFMPSVKCKSSDDPDEVSVKRTKLVFYPSKELVARVGAISYSTENGYRTAEDKGDGDGGSNSDGGTSME